jgi:hypothetical protein
MHHSIDIQVKVRVAGEELVEKAILCPSCGGETRTYEACDEDGERYALLACVLCGNPLAACATEEEMKRRLEELWREVKAYLFPTRKN